MKDLKILYLGTSEGTSGHRAAALSRVGHKVTLVSPRDLAGSFFSRSLASRLNCRSGYRFAQPFIQKRLRKLISEGGRYDIVWVNAIDWLGRSAVELLKGLGDSVIGYVNDDPIGKRDRGRWASFLPAISAYDLCAVVREVNVSEFRERGAQKVVRVFMGYDEVAHRPLDSEEIPPENFRSEVAFVGTWMPERGPFFKELVKQRIPLSIWGDHWSKCPEWADLRGAWRGPAVYGRDYIRAVSGAKVCLGLLSKGNRDLHTTRSAEAPYAGALFCAERTPEHLAMYREGQEAVFWGDANECAAKCRELLDDPERCDRIRLAGMRRARSLQLGNESIARQILLAVGK